MYFNVGIYMGWATMSPTQTISWEVCAPLWAGSVAWTIIVDTIYGHQVCAFITCMLGWCHLHCPIQDKIDDVKIGVMSTALLFGKKTKLVCSGLAATFLVGLTFAGIQNQQTWIYYLVSVGGAGLHLSWQLVVTNMDVNADCERSFFSNQYLGMIVLAGIVLDGANKRL